VLFFYRLRLDSRLQAPSPSHSPSALLVDWNWRRFRTRRPSCDLCQTFLPSPFPRHGVSDLRPRCHDVISPSSRASPRVSSADPPLLGFCSCSPQLRRLNAFFFSVFFPRSVAWDLFLAAKPVTSRCTIVIAHLGFFSSARPSTLSSRDFDLFVVAMFGPYQTGLVRH